MSAIRLSAAKHARHAFTLIELLVVVAILALLMTILLPALGRARAVAVRAVCMANRKTIGTLIFQFVNTHGGRGPSDCWGWDNSHMARGRNWVGYINVEVLGQKHYWETNAGFIQGMGSTQTKGFLYCPSVRFWGGLYARAQEININVAGGDSVGEMYDGIGISVPSQRCVSPPMADDMIPSGKWEVYGLGPRIELFPRPTYEFLVVETEAGWEYWHARTDAQIKLGVATPPWMDTVPPVGAGDMLAFRHTLPPDITLYQQQATANFLFIDGHVEYMNATGHINYRDRSYFNDKWH
jgi:prepilin-type N-terminal cleavage/methylation domain-containing protein/prepilin-type processing-associated H-X9-DG protein